MSQFLALKIMLTTVKLTEYVCKQLEPKHAEQKVRYRSFVKLLTEPLLTAVNHIPIPHSQNDSRNSGA